MGFIVNGNGNGRTKAQAVELIFLDAEHRTEIFRAECGTGDAVPVVGDHATVPDVGNPGTVQYVQIERRHLVYLQREGKTVLFIQLWCRCLP
jgi:hypothetical protein